MFIEVNAEDEEYIERRLNSQTIAVMKGKLAHAINNIQCIIEKNNLDINSLILTLRIADDGKKTIFSTDDAFKKIHSTTELFQHMVSHCSIYDYDLLISLVASIKCKEADKVLKNLKTTLHSSILKDLTLWCDEKLCDPISFMPNTHKLAIKYIGKEECTMKTQNLVKSIIYEHYKLSRASITFKGIEEGCVVFIYQISPAVKAHLLQKTFSDVLSKNDKIKYLAVDGEVIQFKGKCVCCVCGYTFHMPCS